MTDLNQTLFDRAAHVIPGGVNSPVRAFRAVGGTPRFVQRAQSWGTVIQRCSKPYKRPRSMAFRLVRPRSAKLNWPKKS